MMLVKDTNSITNLHLSLVGINEFSFCAVLLLRPPLSYIWLTNKLTTFSVLFSRYPILQSVLTYYSLIRAVYLYRRCVWFQSASSPCNVIVWLILV